MTYRIEIETGNAAFEESPADEIARILRKLADRLEDGADIAESIRLMDYNGNSVGTAGEVAE
jgi:acyl-CoA reductase-like NAD-dependent aldehyde dehydrogenase